MLQRKQQPKFSHLYELLSLYKMSSRSLSAILSLTICLFVVIFICKTGSVLGQISNTQNTPERFDSHKLVLIKNVSATLYSKLLSDTGIDIWSLNQTTITFRASPEIIDGINTFDEIISNEASLSILSDNIQAYLDQGSQTLKRPVKYNSVHDPRWFEAYHSYGHIRSWYKALEKEFPGLIKFVPSIGTTYESTDIFMVKISGHGGNDKRKKSVWIQSLVHAREWISGAVTQYVSYLFLMGYRKGFEPVVQLLDNISIYIVPVVNPDGYTYSRNVNRFWRGNRNMNGSVDLNRNFDIAWGTVGVSSSLDSDVYCGTSAFSEPETRAIRDVYLSLRNIIVALDIHSFSQLILIPVGYNKQKVIHYQSLIQAGTIMANAINETFGATYTVNTLASLYPASGVAMDYFYSDYAYKITGSRPYSMTLELRPKESIPGFLLPASQILLTAKEVSAGIMQLILYALKNPLP